MRFTDSNLRSESLRNDGDLLTSFGEYNALTGLLAHRLDGNPHSVHTLCIVGSKIQ